MLEEVRSEPRSRIVPQSSAGGSRDGTTAKESVVRRRKQHGYEDLEKSIPNSRRVQRNRKSKADKNIEDLEEDGEDSKSDTVKELVAKSKVETEKRSKGPEVTGKFRTESEVGDK